MNWLLQTAAEQGLSHLVRQEAKSREEPQPTATPPEVQVSELAPHTDAPAPATPVPAPAQNPEELDRSLGLPPAETGLAPPPTADADAWDIMGAAWRAETIKTDAWGSHAARRRDMVMEMESLLPDEVRRQIWDRVRDTENWQTAEQVIIETANQVVTENPKYAAAFAKYPLTYDAFQQFTDDQRAADLEAQEDVISQSSTGVAAFIGGSARAMTDPTSLALLPLGGGGGGALRIIMREAALGAAGEAAVLPREYRVAEEMGMPDPDPVTRIAAGAALGGGLAGAIIGVPRGVRMLRDRWTAHRDGLIAAKPDDLAPVEFEAEVDAAEDAMRGQPTPGEALRANGSGPATVMDDLPAGVPQNTPGLGYNEAATLRAIIQAESGGRADAQAATSSALGLGQFISGTWLGMIRKHRPDLMNGRTSNEVLALRRDRRLSAEMTRLYMRDNAEYLARRGVQAGPGEIYLAHFMGPDGAARALSAAPETPLRSVMTAKAIAANAGIRFNGKKFSDWTVYDLRMWSRNKMRAAYGPGANTDMPAFSGGTSRGYTGSGQVAAGDGFRIDVDYEVVDMSSLIRASGDLQPRDRSRISSDAWIADTAARLDPAQLMPSPTADRGTPIVGPDNIIESGNGRFGAIARAFERHPDRAAAYRGQIEAAGFAIPEGVERPVLIARRTSELSPEDRSRFAIEAQDSGVAVMTPTEVARASSRGMTSPVLSQLDPSAPLRAEGNAGFVRAALQGIPRSARNAMFDANGMLNSMGERQLREALFARAWPDPDILARFTEGDAGELKSLLEALERAAPSWAALKADIEAGLVAPEMDITDFVMDAMRLIGTARDLSRKQGMPVANAVQELLDDVDLLEGAISPLTAAMVRKFWKNGRAASADDVAGFLTRYADDARKAGATGSMFDAPSPRDVLRAIDERAFGDLPDDLGAARGYARPDTPEPAGDAPPEYPAGFARGADSPETEAIDTAILADLAPERIAPNVPEPAPRDPDADLPDIDADQITAARADLGDAFDGMEIDQGNGLSASLREVLDDLDADRLADDALNTCMLNPAATFARGATA